MEQESGALVAWSPATRPANGTLTGRYVRLAPIDPERDAPALYAAGHDARDSELWDYLPVGPFPDEGSFTAWLTSAASSADPLFYAVIDSASGKPAGMVSYLRIVPEHGVIEIGFIWFGPALQRTRGATEAIYLLARHAFDNLGHRRLEWKCNARNERSRRAALRFGFTFEGVFRQHMVVKGRNRDTAWYAILDGEWPEIGGAFEAWLAPANFDAAGRQRRTLAELRAATGEAAASTDTAP